MPVSAIGDPRSTRSEMPAPAREENLFDHRNFLESPYEYSFKVYPTLVEAIFQAVGAKVTLPDMKSDLIRARPA